MSDKTVLSSDDQSKHFDIYFKQERYEMLKYLPDQLNTVLEVGCGAGEFGHLLKKERSIEVWGIEPDEQASKIASHKLDRVFNVAFDRSLDLPNKYFDCIIFNDVLEHFVDPYKALIYCKDLLRPGGKIVASIPNVRYFGNIWKLLIKKDWKYTDHGILDRTHLRFFTKLSLINTFESLGYCVDRIEGIHPIDEKHPNHLLKFNFLNLILLNNIEDMRYFQFAIVVHPNDFA